MITEGTVNISPLAKSHAKNSQSANAQKGSKKLDQIINSWQNGDLIIIGARPSVDIWMFTSNVIIHKCVKQNQAVAVFSLDLGKEQMVVRLLCSESGVARHKVIIGELSKKEWPLLIQAAEQLHAAPVYIDDTKEISLQEIAAKVRQLKSEVDVRLVIVDNLQLLAGNEGPEDNRRRAIAECSQALKVMAVDLNVPVVALVELPRGRKIKGQITIPGYSSLNKVGSIEKVADAVLFPHHDPSIREQNDKNDGFIPAQIAPNILIVAKHGHGSTGSIKL